MVPTRDRLGMGTAVALCTAVAVALVFWRAWVADDAVITFRHVDHCLAGHGPVFNVGERVQGFTHPLWFLLLLAGGFLFDPYAVAVGLGLLCTAGISLLLARAWRAHEGGVLGYVLSMGLLFSSPAIVEYQTSGLESPLAHGLVVGLVLSLLAASPVSKPMVSVWCVLLVLTRPDLSMLAAGPMLWVVGSVLVVPARESATRLRPGRDALACTGETPVPHPKTQTAWQVVLGSCLRAGSASEPVGQHEAKLRRRRGPAILHPGETARNVLRIALPWVAVLAWYGFAAVYYGTPLPNTAYAKLGLPTTVTWDKGWRYVQDAWSHEPVHLMLAGAGGLLLLLTGVRGWRRAGLCRLALAAGLLLHAVYVMRVGGDFMRMRFLLPVMVAGMVTLPILLRRWCVERYATDARVQAPGASLHLRDEADQGADRPSTGACHASWRHRWQVPVLALACMAACWQVTGWVLGPRAVVQGVDRLGYGYVWWPVPAALASIVLLAGAWGWSRRLKRRGPGVRAADVWWGLLLLNGLFLAGLGGQWWPPALAVLLFALPVTASAAVLAWWWAGGERMPAWAVSGLVMLTAAVVGLAPLERRIAKLSWKTDATDEYAWYRKAWWENRFREEDYHIDSNVRDWVAVGDACRRYAERYGPITVAWGSIGYFGRHAGPQVHIIDVFGLTDAYVARLPGDPRSRVGHVWRLIPRGYLADRGVLTLQPGWRRRLEAMDPTLREDALRLQQMAIWDDPAAKAAWQRIALMVQGPVFSRERWRAAWTFANLSRPESHDFGQEPGDPAVEQKVIRHQIEEFLKRGLATRPDDLQSSAPPME